MAKLYIEVSGFEDNEQREYAFLRVVPDTFALKILKLVAPKKKEFNTPKKA